MLPVRIHKTGHFRNVAGDELDHLLRSYQVSKTGAVAPDFKFKPGFTYVAVRAIAARVNQNFDGWPSEELKKTYRKWIGKPIFVNHTNEDATKARGKVVAARYVANGPDKYIETVMEVDSQRFPKLAKEIRTGGLDSVSMGVEAGFTICSVCANRATDLHDMCSHIKFHKGETLPNKKTGKKTLVYEKCYKLSWFELSFVFDPADETAVVSRVIAASRDYIPLGWDRYQPISRETEHPKSEDHQPTSVSHTARWYRDAGDLLKFPTTSDEQFAQSSEHDYHHDPVEQAASSVVSQVTTPDGHSLYVFGPHEGLPNPYQTGNDGGQSRHEWVHTHRGAPVNHGYADSLEEARHQLDKSYSRFPLRVLRARALKEVRRGERVANWYRDAYWGKTVAPEDIDTLRNESEDDTDDFHHWVASPPELRAPDMDEAERLDKAQEDEGLDPRRRVEDAEEYSAPAPHENPDSDHKEHPAMPINPPELRKGRRNLPEGAPMSRSYRYATEDDEDYDDGGGYDDGGYEDAPEDQDTGEGGDVDSLLDEAESDIDAYEADEAGDDEGYPADDEDPDSDGDEYGDEDPEGAPPEDEDAPPWLQEKESNYRRAGHPGYPNEGNGDVFESPEAHYLRDERDTLDHPDDYEDGLRRLQDPRHHSRRTVTNRMSRRNRRGHKKENAMTGATLAQRGRVATRGGRRRYADDSGYTDGGPYGDNDSQGAQEEVFISQVPGAESVEAPSPDDGQVSNSPDNLVANRRPQFDPNHYQRLADAVSQLPPAQRRAMADRMVGMLTADNRRFNWRTFFESARVPVVRQGNRYFYAAPTPAPPPPGPAGIDQQFTSGPGVGGVGPGAVNNPPGAADHGFTPTGPGAVDQGFTPTASYRYAEDLEAPETVNPPLSGTDEQSLKGDDFESLALESVETQPKDASIHAFRAFDHWLAQATGRTARQHGNANFIRRAAASYVANTGRPLQNLFPTLEYVLREARNVEERNAMRRRAEDTSLDLAAPQSRIDVEAPVSNVTDEKAQASQFDLGDFAHNAGDQLADPDLNSVRGNAGTWAPDKGKESSVRLASGVEAMRCAEAYVAAMPNTYRPEQRFELTARFETLLSPVVRERIRLLEAVIEDQAKTKAARKVAAVGSRGTRALPPGLGSQRVASTQRIAASDPDTDAVLFMG